MNDHSTLAQVIGIPLDLGAKNLGVDNGPAAFRENKLVDKLIKAGINAVDSGNLTVYPREQLDPGDHRLRYTAEIVRVSSESAKLTEQFIRANQVVIALGGDHSINLGVVAGASVALGGNLGLIYLDAHGDVNTAETTLSGNIHGMHLAALLGYGAPELVNVHGPSVKIAKEKLLHIGGSDFDQAELDFIRREGLHSFTLLDLLSGGIGPLLKRIDDMALRCPNIWVSLDLDVIDMVYAPGAAMPNRQGLTYREISAITEYIGKHCHVVGLDVVEYNPSQDIDNKTAELGIELIAKLLGTKYNWYTNYMSANKLN